MVPIAILSFVLLSTLSSSPGPCESSRALFVRSGEMTWDGFGVEVVRLGDLDGDGLDDLAVSTLGRSQVLLVSGADGATLRVLSGPAGFGHGLLAADVDGDGRSDLVVAAPFASASAIEAGALFVHSGRDGSLLGVFAGRVAHGHLGELLLGPGDVDGDGHDDLLVSEGSTTRLLSVLTGVELPRDEGLAEWADELLALRHAGLPASGVLLPDLDDDGRPERAIAMPWSVDGATGEVVIRSSRTGDVLHRLHSGREQDGFGWSFAVVDDLDGDGCAEFVVGAPSDDEGGPDAGAAYVVSGRRGSLLFVLRGSETGSRLGGAVCGLGDLDGDGVGDILASTASADGRGGLSAFASLVSPRGGSWGRPVLGDRELP